MAKVRLEIRPWLSDMLSAKGWGRFVLEEEIVEGSTLGDLLTKLTAQSQAFDEVLFEPGDTSAQQLGGYYHQRAAIVIA